MGTGQAFAQGALFFRIADPGKAAAEQAFSQQIGRSGAAEAQDRQADGTSKPPYLRVRAQLRKHRPSMEADMTRTEDMPPVVTGGEPPFGDPSDEVQTTTTDIDTRTVTTFFKDEAAASLHRTDSTLPQLADR